MGSLSLTDPRIVVPALEYEISPRSSGTHVACMPLRFCAVQTSGLLTWVRTKPDYHEWGDDFHSTVPR